MHSASSATTKSYHTPPPSSPKVDTICKPIYPMVARPCTSNLLKSNRTIVLVGLHGRSSSNTSYYQYILNRRGETSPLTTMPYPAYIPPGWNHLCYSILLDESRKHRRPTYTTLGYCNYIWHPVTTAITCKRNCIRSGHDNVRRFVQRRIRLLVLSFST